MLQVKSFLISDDKGINDLLKKYSLAKGMHILVSDGKICIPFEDGEPKNNEQKIVEIKEQKSIIFDQLFLLDQSQKVMKVIIGDAKERLTIAEENARKVSYKKDENKVADRKLAEARQAHEQAENQYKMNEHEEMRLKANLAIFDQYLVDLEK